MLRFFEAIPGWFMHGLSGMIKIISITSVIAILGSVIALAVHLLGRSPKNQNTSEPKAQ